MTDFKHRTPKQNTPSRKSFLEKKLADQFIKHLFRKGFQSVVHLECLFCGCQEIVAKNPASNFCIFNYERVLSYLPQLCDEKPFLQNGVIGSSCFAVRETTYGTDVIKAVYEMYHVKNFLHEALSRLKSNLINLRF